MQIQRSTFQSAIEAGIANTPDLSAENAEKLREVGRTVTQVGYNFSIDGLFGLGCAWSLAGLGHSRLPGEGDPLYFSRSYDRALHLPPFSTGLIEIV